MTKLLEFETERLRLRQWKAADREPFTALNADPRVMKFFPGSLDRSASDAMADHCESLIRERDWGLWATETKEAGQFIGFVGLHIPSSELPFSPCVEIGWRLAFQYWGHGFATEAARGALRVGFELLGLPEIVTLTAVSNTKSRAVMERLGMRESPGTFEHPSVPIGNVLREHCLYQLSCGQWREYVV